MNQDREKSAVRQLFICDYGGENEQFRSGLGWILNALRFFEVGQQPLYVPIKARSRELADEGFRKFLNASIIKIINTIDLIYFWWLHMDCIKSYGVGSGNIDLGNDF